MSERDRRLAERYAAKGKQSATEKAKAKEQQRRTTGGGQGMSEREAMQRLIEAPRDSASRSRARSHQSAAADGSGGESYADRTVKSTTRWSRRAR